MKYVAEIDGLRAIAVIAVVIYHVNPGWVGGGFVGVDVFFVISGFLISGLLLADIDGGRLSLPRFYARRILRIAPALCVTLAVTAAVFFALFPPIWTSDLLISLVTAVLSVSNLWFYATVDYFASNNASPLLHTWSLAVEEQFYLLFPLLLFLLGRKGSVHRRIGVFVILLAMSLAACIVATRGQGSSSYFLPWLRAWELLCGSLLASIPIAALSRPIRQVLSFVGIAMVLTACFLYNDSTPFPSYAALLPCLGAVAVIAGAGSGGPVNHLLQTAPMNGIGKISYSLYLVHWPLVCAASLTITLHSLTVKLTVVVASVLLAWLSWRYIESPFRGMAGQVSQRRVFIGFGLACGTLICIFFLMQVASAHFWHRYPAALHHTTFLRTNPLFFRPDSCFITQSSLDNFRKHGCLEHDTKRPAVLLIGDSHAANIYQALAERFPQWQVLQATAPGCKPVVDTRGAPTCVELVNHMLDTWISTEGGSVSHVVLAAQWAHGDIGRLRRTVERLRRSGKQVIIYGPVPEHFIAVPLLLAYSEISGLDLREHLFKHDRVTLDQEMRSAFSEGSIYFSPLTGLCRGSACELVYLGDPVLFDRDHLSLSGARLAVKGFPLPTPGTR